MVQLVASRLRKAGTTSYPKIELPALAIVATDCVISAQSWQSASTGIGLEAVDL